ncbi:MFS transporter, partial [Streptomyces sp. SID2131]|nr:MFS transporter [Streptomyces sp. SID2131]
ARDVFTDGLNIVGGIGALVAVASAVLVAVVVKLPPTGAGEGADESEGPADVAAPVGAEG